MKVYLFIILLIFVGCHTEQPTFCEYTLEQGANEVWMIYADGGSIDLAYPYTSPDFQPLVDTLNAYLEENDTSNDTAVMMYVDSNRTIHFNIWSSITFDSVRFSNTPGGAFPFYQSFEVNCE